MLKQVRFCSLMLLVLCQLSATLFATVDACSPTKSKPKNTTVNIPDAGKPKTPASGVADGWVLLYEDSGFQKLNNEVYCKGDRIQFATSDGKKNFNKHPNCQNTTCTKAVESGYVTQVALKGTFGNTNTFVWHGNFPGFLVLHDFTGSPSDGGYSVYAPLIRDGAGNLYGTTFWGGSGCSSCGTVFKIDASGTETLLYSFPSGPAGAQPRTNLVRDSSGNLYGTGSSGGEVNGQPGAGVVFKLDTNNQETVLYTFTGGTDGRTPFGGLVRDSSGNFYGTTIYGGDSSCNPSTNGCGTVFKVDTNNNNMETVLYSFKGGNDGASPADETLAIDKSGNLYGTTIGGGTSGCGTVFKLDTSNNTETVLHSFAGGKTDGCYTEGGLTRDSAGNLYGTTYAGGSHNQGTVWKIDTTNTETVMYNFKNGADGGDVLTGVVLDSSNNLYGVACGGGTNGSGTLFQVTPGRLKVLYSFRGPTDGKCPMGGLFLAPDNNLYGTTSEGGSSGGGCGGGGCGTVWGFDLR